MYELLSGIKVLEWAELIAGPYSGKILADLGAEVIKAEEPARGDSARYREPFLNDEPHSEKSGLYLWLNTNKIGITLDMTSSTGKNIFKQLLKQADLLIHDKPPQILRQLELEYAELQKVNPRLVVTAITPFGQTGPYSQYKSYPLNTFHSGGEGYMTPGGSTFRDRPPIRSGKYVGEYACAIAATAATLVALYAQRTTGQGQLVDVCQQHVLAQVTHFDLFRWPNYGIQVDRFTRGYPYTGVLECRDGWIIYSPMREDDWDAMVKVIDSPEWTNDEKFKTKENRDGMGKELLKKLQEETRKFTRDELYKRAREFHCALAPCNNPGEVVKSEQLKYREFFVDIDRAETGKLKYPSYPYRFSASKRQPNNAAPLLGQHNKQIYCERLGLSPQELIKLREAGVI